MTKKLEVRSSRGSAGPFLYNLFLFEGRMKLRVCMKNSRDCGVREAPNICPPNFYTAYTEGGFISKEKTKIDDKRKKAQQRTIADKRRRRSGSPGRSGKDAYTHIEENGETEEMRARILGKVRVCTPEEDATTRNK